MPSTQGISGGTLVLVGVATTGSAAKTVMSRVRSLPLLGAEPTIGTGPTGGSRCDDLARMTMTARAAACSTCSTSHGDAVYARGVSRRSAGCRGPVTPRPARHTTRPARRATHPARLILDLRRGRTSRRTHRVTGRSAERGPNLVGRWPGRLEYEVAALGGGRRRRRHPSTEGDRACSSWTSTTPCRTVRCCAA